MIVESSGFVSATLWTVPGLREAVVFAQESAESFAGLHLPKQPVLDSVTGSAVALLIMTETLFEGKKAPGVSSAVHKLAFALDDRAVLYVAFAEQRGTHERSKGVFC